MPYKKIIKINELHQEDSFYIDFNEKIKNKIFLLDKINPCNCYHEDVKKQLKNLLEENIILDDKYYYCEFHDLLSKQLYVFYGAKIEFLNEDDYPEYFI